MYQLIEGLDKHGKVTQQKLNNGLLTELASYHPATGQMTSIKTSSSAGAQDKHHLTYSYDGFSNLKQQLVIANGVSNSEQYDYDGLHRLVQSSRSLHGANPSSVTVQYAYDAVGNFLSKGDFATNYQYASGKPNAVSQVTKLDGSVVQYGYDNVGNMTSGDGKTLSYNAFNKPTLITNNSISSAFSYGADLSRYKQVKTTGAKTETTHYVDKLFEKVVTQETGKATTTEYVHYIGDVAIVRKKVTAGQALPEHRIGFTHRDRLGSVVTVTDHNGNATEHRSYDAFGKPRKGDFSNPSTATLTSASGLAAGKSLIANRGFTDHEHLDEHQLIHMNGRAYDYNLGRFLSVDPFIQAPGNSQSMNPYSYIMNNPLSGTDPSGYIAKSKGSASDISQEQRMGNEIDGQPLGCALSHGGDCHNIVNGNGARLIQGEQARVEGDVKAQVENDAKGSAGKNDKDISREDVSCSNTRCVSSSNFDIKKSNDQTTLISVRMIKNLQIMVAIRLKVRRGKVQSLKLKNWKVIRAYKA